jgi:hypothetical protein
VTLPSSPGTVSVCSAIWAKYRRMHSLQRYLRHQPRRLAHCCASALVFAGWQPRRANVPPPAFAVAGLERMVSGKDESAAPATDPAWANSTRARKSEPPKALLKALMNSGSIVRKRHHHCENNELVELLVLPLQKVRSLSFCGKPDASCDSNSANRRSRGSIGAWTPRRLADVSGDVRCVHTCANLNLSAEAP